MVPGKWTRADADNWNVGLVPTKKLKCFIHWLVDTKAEKVAVKVADKKVAVKAESEKVAEKVAVKVAKRFAEKAETVKVDVYGNLKAYK